MHSPHKHAVNQAHACTHSLARTYCHKHAHSANTHSLTHSLIHTHTSIHLFVLPYLYVPEPEFGAVVGPAGDQVGVVGAPGQVGHPIGVAVQRLQLLQLVCLLANTTSLSGDKRCILY